MNHKKIFINGDLKKRKFNFIIRRNLYLFYSVVGKFNIFHPGQMGRFFTKNTTDSADDTGLLVARKKEKLLNANLFFKLRKVHYIIKSIFKFSSFNYSQAINSSNNLLSLEKNKNFTEPIEKINLENRGKKLSNAGSSENKKNERLRIKRAKKF